MKKRIFLVDDKVTIGRILTAYLSEDYEIEYFEDPSKCITRLDAGVLPNLIISDIMMPIMRGDEFLAYIRKDERYKKIPMIMLSGEDSSTDRVRLLQGGADDYIVKPFNPLELKIRVSKILG